MRNLLPAHVITFICMALTACCCTGCLTTMLLGETKKDRRPERVRQVQNAFIDSGNYLVVNFTATLNGRKKEEPCHVRVPVDTALYLLALLRESRIGYRADTASEARHGISRVFNVSENPALFPGQGVNMELKRSVLQKGYYTPAGQDSLPGKLLVSTRKQDFGYGKRYPHYTPYGRLNARHIVFVYYPEEKPRIDSSIYDYMAISIEPSSKKRLYRYSWLPLTVGLDAVSLPFQVVGAGILLLGYKSGK